MPGLLAAAIGAALATAGCEREARRFQDPFAASTAPRTSNVSPYRENAYGMGQGQRLFTQFNCVGCHAEGGGAIGPALMDAAWTYGAEPGQIFTSIASGRPNGMPAFGRRVPDQQLWQLVAYVQSLSVQVPRDAAPGRRDAMSVRRPELRLERQEPRQTEAR
jgi:cytochrome c oxidase cbb3-type subunit 3